MNSADRNPAKPHSVENHSDSGCATRAAADLTDRVMADSETYLRTSTVMRMFEEAGEPCSRSTLDRLRQAGRCSATALSRRNQIGFKKSDVERYLAERLREKTNDAPRLF